MKSKFPIEYVLFPQLYMTYLLKKEQKWLFFVIGFILLPYNLVVLTLYLIVIFLIFLTMFFVEKLKNIFTKR